MAGAPYYADEDIVNFLTFHFEMKVTNQDLKLLKPDFVQKIYCNFLQDFGASLDLISQFPIDVCDSVRQHPHVFTSVGKSMILAKAISNFLKRIDKDSEFVPADLFDPKVKRTKKFISVLIEFYLCAKTHYDALASVEEKAKIKLEGKEALMEDNTTKEEKIGQLKLEKEENQIREEQMLKRIATMNNEIQEVLGEKIAHKAQFDQIKVDIASFITNIKALELEILEKKERVEILAGQVVQASERQEIEERENRLAASKNDNALRTANLSTLKQTVEVCKLSLELINNEMMPTLQEIQQEMANVKEHNATISQHERSKRSLLEEAEDYEMKSQQLKETVASRQEKISQMQIAWKVKKEMLQVEIDQYKATMNEIWRSQTEDEIVSQDLQKEQLKNLHEIQQFKEQIIHFDLFVATHFQKILQAMEKLNTEVQGSLATLVEAANGNHSENE